MGERTWGTRLDRYYQHQTRFQAISTPLVVASLPDSPAQEPGNEAALVLVALPNDNPSLPNLYFQTHSERLGTRLFLDTVMVVVTRQASGGGSTRN